MNHEQRLKTLKRVERLAKEIKEIEECFNNMNKSNNYKIKSLKQKLNQMEKSEKDAYIISQAQEYLKDINIERLCNFVESFNWIDDEDTDPKKEIRPFNGPKEFLHALKEHGGWMYARLQCLFIPVEIYIDSIKTLDGTTYTFEKILQLFTFCDGTPCGIIEND